MGPRIVSGLFGKASMVLLLVKLSWVFWGRRVVFGGSLWENPVMRLRMRLVCLHEGPIMPMALLGLVTAYQSRSADMM